MGSKAKLVPAILETAKLSPLNTVVDAFSGSGIVSHAFKLAGYKVISNDVLNVAYNWSLASVQNSTTTLSDDELELLVTPDPAADDFISKTFHGLYFTDTENQLLDSFFARLRKLDDEYKKAMALAAMTRACLKRRPRGVFTYVGNRYDDGRRDLRIPLEVQFRESVASWNESVFDNGQINRARRGSALELEVDEPALWYIDPPYFNPKSDNDYTRRYHFIEGLTTYWDGIEIQTNTKTKKFRTTHKEFQSKANTYESFAKLFAARAQDDLLISYSSNSLPNRDDLSQMLRDLGREVNVTEVDHTYSFGTHGHIGRNVNNRVREFLFFSPSQHRR